MFKEIRKIALIQHQILNYFLKDHSIVYKIKNYPPTGPCVLPLTIDPPAPRNPNLSSINVVENKDFLDSK